jgi:hypothetical protein
MILLDDSRLDSSYNCCAFKVAVQKSHTEIARMTSSLDASESSVLVDALKNGNIELYSLMISNRNFNPRAEDSFLSCTLEYLIQDSDHICNTVFNIIVFNIIEINRTLFNGLTY